MKDKTKKWTKQDYVIGLPFFIIAICMFLPVDKFVDYIHIRCLYSVQQVEKQNLYISGTSQSGLRISNGDILPFKQVTINFFASAITWIISSILLLQIYLFCIVRLINPELYRKIKNKENLE